MPAGQGFGASNTGENRLQPLAAGITRQECERASHIGWPVSARHSRLFVERVIGLEPTTFCLGMLIVPVPDGTGCRRDLSGIPDMPGFLRNSGLYYCHLLPVFPGKCRTHLVHIA
jgi:hypothetical protein